MGILTKKTTYTDEEVNDLYRRITSASKVMKLCMGISINAAIYMMVQAHRDAMGHPNYRHKIKAAFNQARKVRESWEILTKHGYAITSFFRVEDTDTTYFKEGITDEEYFEIWGALGGAGYDLSIDEINVLKHKYYLILERNGDKYPNIGASLFTTVAMLRNADYMYKVTLNEISKNIPDIPRECLSEHILKDFDIHKISEAWERAVFMLYNDKNLTVTDFEDKNLTMALTSLKVKYVDAKWIIKVEERALRYYPEYFDSKRQLNELIKKIKEAFNKEGRLTMV